jgi:hypothetical protein
MPRKKPAAVVVIAILQIVFGSLGLCAGLYGLSGIQERLNASMYQNNNMAAANAKGAQPFNPADMQKQIETKIPHYNEMQKASSGATTVLALMMIVSGIGLLMMQAWARVLAIVYAILSILVTIGSVIYSAAVVLPAMSAIMQDMMNQVAKQAGPGAGGPPAAAMGQVMQGAMIIGVVLNALVIVYPILVLVIMLLPSVAAAFAGRPVRRAPKEPEDYRDPAEEGDEPDERYRAGDR